MPVQLDVKRAAAFCIGHLVCRGQLVHRRIGGQTVCKKLLMAGHELRIRDVEIVIRADAMILEWIQAAAKLALDYDGVQARRAELAIQLSKLCRTHRLIQYLADDLLFGHGK